MNSQASSASIDLRPQPLADASVSHVFDTAFLGAAAFSLVLSVSLWFTMDQPLGIFVGLWVPSIIGLWAGLKVSALLKALQARPQ